MYPYEKVIRKNKRVALLHGKEKVGYESWFNALPITSFILRSTYHNNKAPHFCEAFVNPLVQNSNSLLEDLRRLNQLKDIKNQIDTTSPKIDKPATAQVPKPSKGVKLRK